MVPYEHARLSCRDFGGKPEDYLHIHKFLDSTKFQLTDYRHRSILHNPFGIQLCEMLYGDIVINSDGNQIPVREIARRHIVEDCGKVPTTKEWIDSLCDGTSIKLNNPSKRDIKWLKEN